MARRRLPGVARTTTSPSLLEALAADRSPEVRRAALANRLCTAALAAQIADSLDWANGAVADFDCRGASLVLLKCPDYLEHASGDGSFRRYLQLHLIVIAGAAKQPACKWCQPNRSGVFQRHAPDLFKVAQKM